MITPYFEPRENVLRKIERYPMEPEMTEYESGILCGIIREERPKKIVEVGVAAGGTTGIILECLSKLGYECEVHSCDLAEKYYIENERETGFLVKDRSASFDLRNHTFHLGGYLPEYLDEIGGEIDLAIIDTVHAMPGEILDFLAIYPYMSKGGIVVIHDITYAQYYVRTTCPNSVLMSCIAGDRLESGRDPERPSGYPNIGAIRLNMDTKKYITNAFSALMLNWDYLPESREREIYRNFYRRFYSPQDILIMDNAFQNNAEWIAGNRLQYEVLERIIYHGDWRKFSASIKEIPIPKTEYYYVYGHGDISRKCLKYLLRSGIKITAILDKNASEKEEESGIPVVRPDKARLDEIKRNCGFIMVLVSKYDKEIADELMVMGLEENRDYIRFEKAAQLIANEIVKEMDFLG